MADGSKIPAEITVRRVRKWRVADLFCGAGGFSTGATRAFQQLDVPISLVAANHWPTAIATHQQNHPDAAHYCVDLETARPRELVPGGVLDLLMASPSCTHHSRARGGRPTNDQQRMDPWHVVRFCTELRVHRLLIENVPEIVKWGPVHIQTGKPIKSREGEYFNAWIAALRAIGFNRIEWRVLNCANYGDATTRERWFLLATSNGSPLFWPEPTHADGGAADLLGTRDRWRGAAEIIDWSLQGKSIFGRKKSLAPNTLRRILAGAERYKWPAPYVEAIRALLDGREPILDVDAGAVQPMLLHLRGTSGDALQRSALPLNAPLPTLTAGGGHVGLVMATASGGVAREITEPVPTIVGGNGARPHYITPLIVHRCNSEGGRNARPVDEPTPTVATRGAGYLATPIIGPYYGGGSGATARSVEEPLPTTTTKARFGMAEPFVMSITHQGSPRVRSIEMPLPTVTTANRGELGVAQPFLVPNLSEDGHQKPRTHDINKPLPTVTASGHMQLAEPFLVRAAHGDSDGRDPASRVLDSAAPLPAQTGSNEFAVVEPVAVAYRIDIHYRMLAWRELARAMSFDDEGHLYEFKGNATEITKQIGNAVPCRTAKALVRAVLGAP